MVSRCGALSPYAASWNAATAPDKVDLSGSLELATLPSNPMPNLPTRTSAAPGWADRSYLLGHRELLYGPLHVPRSQHRVRAIHAVRTPANFLPC